MNFTTGDFLGTDLSLLLFYLICLVVWFLIPYKNYNKQIRRENTLRIVNRTSQSIKREESEGKRTPNLKQNNPASFSMNINHFKQLTQRKSLHFSKIQ